MHEIDKIMLIKEIASLAEVGVRTIQRDIESFNKQNQTFHSKGLADTVVNESLLSYLEDKRGFVRVEEDDGDDPRIEPLVAVPNLELIKEGIIEATKDKAVKTNTSSDSSGSGRKSRQRANSKPKSKKKTDLQTILSANWMVIVVLLVILWVDMFCFGVIGDHEFGEKWPLSWLPFSLIGLAVGFGSIVTYNRISNEKTANTWKYVFGGLQLLLFEFVINEWLVLSGGVAGLMFVIVSIGTQRSIKG